MKIFHVIKFSPTKRKLVVRQLPNKLPEINLDGFINFKVLPGKFCIGYWKNQSYFKCFKKIQKGFQCESCFKKETNNFCAMCNGTKCFLRKPICGQHYVYLASFGNILKVGVTSVNRFPERVIEQGADFAARIVLVENGLIARKIERMISINYNIKDKISAITKQKVLLNKNAREIGKEFLKTVYWQIIDKLPAKIKLDLEIEDLSIYYKEPQKAKAISIEDNMELQGKIIGQKGNYIFIKNHQGIFMFNGYELVSRVVKIP